MRTWEKGRGGRATVDFRGTQLIFLFAIFDDPIVFAPGHHERLRTRVHRASHPFVYVTRRDPVSRDRYSLDVPLDVVLRYLIMSPPDSHSPTLTPTTPPRPRSSNKTLPSPLRPNSAPQSSSSQRPTFTPTTASPRPAIGSAVSPATPPPERSKARAMDLLRKHYGLNVTPPPPSGRPMDPMDLGQHSSRNIPRLTNKVADSPAFDAKAYYDQLITTASLTTLLKKENDLLTGEL